MNAADQQASDLLPAIRKLGLDSVRGAFDFAGGDDLSKPDLGLRRRTRIKLIDEAGRPQEVYLKRYGRGGPLTRLLVGLKLAASPGARELANIRRVRRAGVSTMRELICGQADGRSYVLFTAVPGDALSRRLESLLAQWPPQRLEQFNRRLLDLVRALHGAGLVHRDLYAAHIFIDDQPQGPQLHLIDLARVFRPRFRRFRWRVKDLAQLKYSMPPQWVSQCWDAFLAGYLNGLPGKASWEAAIRRKVSRMARRHRKRGGAA